MLTNATTATCGKPKVNVISVSCRVPADCCLFYVTTMWWLADQMTHRANHHSLFLCLLSRANTWIPMLYNTELVAGIDFLIIYVDHLHWQPMVAVTCLESQVTFF